MKQMSEFHNGFRLFRDIDVLGHKPCIFYLAYGSNLSLERMQSRCPDAEVVSKTEIPGYRLLFKKSASGFYATIEQDANCRVPVLVYKISEYDEALLNRYEGYPKHYYKKHFQLPIKTMKGGRLKGTKQCMVYVLHEDRLLGEPTMEYFNLLDEGYAKWGFDTEILDKALADSIGVKPAKEYLRQYQSL